VGNGTFSESRQQTLSASLAVAARRRLMFVGRMKVWLLLGTGAFPNNSNRDVMGCLAGQLSREK
jgi:hypothetical protein